MEGACVSLLCSAQEEAHRVHLESRSQLGQEMFALYANGFERDGFFVEFGAADGINLSNTLILERQFGWDGILAEANKSFSRELIKNRSAAIDTRAVTDTSGGFIEFLEAGLNSSAFSKRNMARWGQVEASYSVSTVSLLDLLREKNAPQQIGFLSIDTEGYEYEALSSIDFSHYSFNAIAVERNVAGEKISDLMAKNGYMQVLKSLSLWDMWFVPVSNRHGLPG